MNDATELRMLMIGGALTSLGINAFLQHRLQKTLARTPNLSNKDLKKVFSSAGIDQQFPTFPVNKLENAYYMEPSRSLPKELEGKVSPELMGKVKQLGLIAYDPKYNKAGIMAHEAGHAAIRTTKPWYNPSRINQGALRTFGDVLRPAAGMLGSTIGLLTGNPLYGALSGLGAAAVLSTPTLVNEAQATGYARRYLDSSTHKKTTRERNHKALSKAYNTYLTGSLLSPAISGALAGGWSHFHHA